MEAQILAFIASVVTKFASIFGKALLGQSELVVAEGERLQGQLVAHLVEVGSDALSGTTLENTKLKFEEIFNEFMEDVADMEGLGEGVADVLVPEAKSAATTSIEDELGFSFLN